MVGGRPSKYVSSLNKRVYKLALLGATDKEIAEIFDIAESTLNEWKLKYPKFSESIKKGKIEADANVAASLYKRAIGFTYDEVTFEKIDGKLSLEATSEGEIKTQDAYKKKIVTKLVPGDVAAQNIWLKNRRSKAKVKEGGQHWADKQETGLTDSEGNDLPSVMFYIPDNGRTFTNPAANDK